MGGKTANRKGLSPWPSSGGLRAGTRACLLRVLTYPPLPSFLLCNFAPELGQRGSSLAPIKSLTLVIDIGHCPGKKAIMAGGVPSPRQELSSQLPGVALPYSCWRVQACRPPLWVSVSSTVGRSLNSEGFELDSSK